MFYEIIKSVEEHFDTALAELLRRVDALKVPVRMVFFGAPLSEEQYSVEKLKIARALSEKYGDKSPVFSYVSQPPLASTLLVEVHSIASGDGVSYHTTPSDNRYLVVERDGIKYLLTSGIGCLNLRVSIEEQSVVIFDEIAHILSAEGFSASDIVRQWNYIEHITSLGDCGQNYQQFNNIRSTFYDKVQWANGYPAATGIGTQWGGVVVELDAIRCSSGECGSGLKIVALNNSLQIAAHEYSKNVLLGGKELATPKFERGKAVVCGDIAMLYVSGTAAIRGELSLRGVGIKEQTLATLENIEYLISTENLDKHGVHGVREPKIAMLRVYLKHRSDYLQARGVIEELYARIPALYVLSDVCREELLVEIESVAL